MQARDHVRRGQWEEDGGSCKKGVWHRTRTHPSKVVWSEAEKTGKGDGENGQNGGNYGGFYGENHIGNKFHFWTSFRLIFKINDYIFKFPINLIKLKAGMTKKDAKLKCKCNP